MFFFQRKLEDLLGQRNVYSLVLVALSAALIAQSVALYRSEQRLVIVPTTGPSFWIEETNVSEQYLKDFGNYMSHLLLTRTPKDVSQKNDIILKHVHPSSLNSIQMALVEEQKEITKNKSSFLFESQIAQAIEKKLQFKIQGIQKTYLDRGSRAATLLEKKKKKYVLSFICEGGRLYLKAIKQETPS